MDTPKLRFNSSKEPWTNKKIIDIAPLQRGFDLPNSELIEGDYPVCYSNGVLNYHNEYKILGPGVVTGRSGTLGKVHYIEHSYWPHNTTLWVTDFKDNNPKFIYYFYQNINLEKFTAGSTVPTLNRNDVHIEKRFIPTNLKEQKKISDFFTFLDKKITLQQEKIDLLKVQKKGYKQKIFNQELRFKDKKEQAYPEWEYIKLGKLTKKTGPKNKEGIKYPVAAISNKKGFTLEGDRNYSNADVDIKSYKIVKRDEFAYNPARINVGSFGFQNVSEVAIVSSLYVVFQTLEKLSNPYLKTYMHSEYFNKDVIKNTEGSVREYLFYENFSNIKIPLPCLEEQEKIASFLLKLEDKIQLEEQKLDYLQQQKQWFMQQMFI